MRAVVVAVWADVVEAPSLSEEHGNFIPKSRFATLLLAGGSTIDWPWDSNAQLPLLGDEFVIGLAPRSR